MSETVDVLRGGYTAYAEAGNEGVLAYFDENVVIDEAPEFPDTGTFSGHEGVEKLLALFTDNFDEFRMEPVDFIEGTEGRGVVIVKLTGVAKVSQVPVEVQSFHVHTVSNGKSVRMRIFLNPDAAFKAAGLSK